MATLEYVEVPPYATRLQPTSLRAQTKIQSTLPTPQNRPSTFKAPATSSNIPGIGGQAISLLLSSSFNLPADAASDSSNHPASSASSSSSRAVNKPKLLSSRDPLSIPITTANFRRFVAKVGPVFWLQDRVEEVILWRRGSRVTGSWMALYAFFCYFPRLTLLIPHTILLSVLISTHPSFSLSLHTPPSSDTAIPTPPPAQAPESSPAWQANLTAIQNLMGFVADLDDFILPFLPHLTHRSPYSPLLAALCLATLPFVLALVVLPAVPMRAVALVGGWAAFAMGHPVVRGRVLPALAARVRSDKGVRGTLARAADDAALADAVWGSELREVELWENERWAAEAGEGVGDGNGSGSGRAGWAKGNLRAGERGAWTRGRDGWSGVGEGDVSSNLTFSLAPGWRFVETEDWRPDLHAEWGGKGVGGDYDGWIYTNDAWQDALPTPTHPKTGMGTAAGWGGGAGVTRRRRWVRRIYYSEEV